MRYSIILVLCRIVAGLAKTSDVQVLIDGTLHDLGATGSDVVYASGAAAVTRQHTLMIVTEPKAVTTQPTSVITAPVPRHTSSSSSSSSLLKSRTRSSSSSSSTTSSSSTELLQPKTTSTILSYSTALSGSRTASASPTALSPSTLSAHPSASGLTAAAKAGIGIGIAFGILLVAVGAYCLGKHGNRKNALDNKPVVGSKTIQWLQKKLELGSIRHRRGAFELDGQQTHTPELYDRPASRAELPTRGSM